ncbi:MAG: MAPEG family protein [Pseudomonadota bacterium]
MLTFEICCLAWVLVLAVVQILLPVAVKTGQFGLKWSMSARDDAPAAMSPLAARLTRAQANLFETLPLFIAAILIATVAGRTGQLTYWGALLFLVARVAYVPIYAAGISVLRTLVWFVSMAGLVMVLAAILMPQ